MPTGWAGYTYAVDDKGKRVACPHSGEGRAVQQITGMSYTEAVAAGRTGYANDCVCLPCLKQFDLDVERDARLCPQCAPTEVRTLRRLVGQACPKCKKGVIEEGSPIRWKLDADWETLPVPQIVKDLALVGEDEKIRTSPKTRQTMLDAESKPTFASTVSTLLKLSPIGVGFSAHGHGSANKPIRVR
jgi:hypothetical protein